MRELFQQFQPEFSQAPVVKEVQYAYQLMVWMSHKKSFPSPKDTIATLMNGVITRIQAFPRVYQIGLMPDLTIETTVPQYSQENNGATAHAILVPVNFDQIFNLPFRMHQALTGLVSAASQLRYDGNAKLVEYHREAFLKSVH